MLKVHYTRLSAHSSSADLLEKMLPRLPGAVHQQILDIRHPAVALRRAVGQWLIALAIRDGWNLSPLDYTILRSPGGKPVIEGHPSVHFNVSHSGDYVLCAASSAPVGVDIELRGLPRLPVARRFYHSAEIDRLERLSPADQSRCFYDYWSAKEAFLKYLGTGLARPLNTFIVEFTPAAALLREEEHAAPLPLRLLPLAIDPAYSSFLCTPLDESPLLVEHALPL